MSVWRSLHYALIALMIMPAIVLADAGAVRISQRRGNRQITVFTDPTPLRAGPVDVSILVQDTSTGGAILDDAITISVAPLGRSSFAAHYRATNAAASNKLFQAAKFDLPHAGQWEFTMDVQGAEETARLHFDAAVAEPLPPWQTLWPWFCWPFLVVALFALFQFRRTSRAGRYTNKNGLGGFAYLTGNSN